VTVEQRAGNVLDRLGRGLRVLQTMRLRLCTARQRPAPRVLNAEYRGATAPPSTRPGAPLARRHQQCAQSGKAVGRHETQGDELSQAFFDLGSQQARVEQLVEERRAMLLDMFEHGLSVTGRLWWLRSAGERGPERRVAAREQCDRRGPHRRRAVL